MTKGEWAAWIETVKPMEGRQSGRQDVFSLVPDISTGRVVITYRQPQSEETNRKIEVEPSLSGSGIDLLEHQLLPGYRCHCTVGIRQAHNIYLDLRGPEPVISASGLSAEKLALLNSQRQDPLNETKLFARVKR